MTEHSAFLKSWLLQVGADQVVEALSAMLDCGALFAVDAECRIVFWSKGAERLLGLSRSEVLGRTSRSIPPLSHCAVSKKLSAGEVIQGDAMELPGSVGMVKVRQAARPFFDEQGRFAGALEVLWPESAVAVPPRPPTEDATENFHGILTRDPAMKQACRVIRNVAQTEATVLIRGESGTGKELVARAIHAESHRATKPFLAVNCAAISANLLESELFGHVRGAFTGALRDHAGLFQRADGGTLFLDEVAELPLELQAKLLRVLQERDFVPVGGDRAIKVDVRIVAATHRSLRDQVREGRFREDLMYRLRVVPLFLPALRERRQDISLLLWHNIDNRNAQGHRRVVRVDPDAMRALLDYAWPGNVRELQNVMEYAFAVGRGDVLRLEDLPPEFREERAASSQPPRSMPPLRVTGIQEADLIREALREFGGRIEPAARSLGMSRATFWRKRKQHGL
jgi:transcriptional regulator with PAS, ATPase and Fis domain